VLALLALDYYHGCRHERGREDTAPFPSTMKAQMSEGDASTTQSASTVSHECSIRHRQSSTNVQTPNESISSARSVQLPRKPPHTYHPLHSPRLSHSKKFLLESAYDALFISLLIAHIAIYFTSIPSSLRACNRSSDDLSEATDPLNTKLTIKQRCYRINIDIHVAGNFDVALSLVLLGLHIWHLVYHLEEGIHRIVHNTSSSLEDGDMEAGNEQGFGVHAIGRSLPNAQFVSYTEPRGSCGLSSSVDEERRLGMDMGVRHRDWSKEKRGGSERTFRTWSGGLDVESVRWKEALLECLVP
jgi:hypothetical protein